MAEPEPDRQMVKVKLPNGLVFQKFGNEWAWVDPQGGFLPVVSDRLEEGGYGIVLSRNDLLTALLSMQTERDAERERRVGAEKVVDAVLEYDRAIESSANDPKKMASFCTAQGEDLDTLYFRWLNGAKAYRTRYQREG